MDLGYLTVYVLDDPAPPTGIYSTTLEAAAPMYYLPSDWIRMRGIPCSKIHGSLTLSQTTLHTRERSSDHKSQELVDSRESRVLNRVVSIYKACALPWFAVNEQVVRWGRFTRVRDRINRYHVCVPLMYWEVGDRQS